MWGRGSSPCGWGLGALACIGHEMDGWSRCDMQQCQQGQGHRAINEA